MMRPSLRPRHFAAIAIMGATGASLLACGGDTEDPAKSIKLEDYATTFQTALCGWEVKCGQSPDAGTCDRTVAPDPDIAQAVASVVFGDLTYDPLAAKVCVDALTKSDCEVVYGKGFAKAVTEACAKVFTNLGAIGAACFSGSECQSTFCKPPMDCKQDCCVGTCDQIPQNIAVGGDCDPAQSNCAVDAYCSGKDKKCAARIQANQTCDGDGSCIDGYACDSGGTSTCFKKSKSGEQCNPALAVNPCLSFNDFCDPAASKCVKLPQAGQACTMPGNDCARDSGCADGTCKLAPIEGEDCSNNCLGSLRCSDHADGELGKCLPLQGSSTCVAP